MQKRRSEAYLWTYFLIVWAMDVKDWKAMKRVGFVEMKASKKDVSPVLLEISVLHNKLLNYICLGTQKEDDAFRVKIWQI